jgi:hypothetical protein
VRHNYIGLQRLPRAFDGFTLLLHISDRGLGSITTCSDIGLLVRDNLRQSGNFPVSYLFRYRQAESSILFNSLRPNSLNKVTRNFARGTGNLAHRTGNFGALNWESDDAVEKDGVENHEHAVMKRFPDHTPTPEHEARRRADGHEIAEGPRWLFSALTLTPADVSAIASRLRPMSQMSSSGSIQRRQDP